MPGRTVDELREHRAEKYERLRVRHAHDEAVAHRAAIFARGRRSRGAPGRFRLPGHRSSDRARQVVATAYRLHAKPHQVGGSGQLEDGERLRRALEGGPQADGHAGGDQVVPRGVPERRSHRGPAAVRERPADHEEHAGPWDDDQDHGRERISQQLIRGDHRSTITARHRRLS